MVSPNRRYTCREFLHEVNWKVVSPDSTVGIYIQYIYITKIVVLVSEPVRGRSRANELPCFLRKTIISHLMFSSCFFMLEILKSAPSLTG